MQVFRGFFLVPTLLLFGLCEFSFAEETLEAKASIEKPTVVVMVAEREYETDESLAKFASEHLKEFEVVFVRASSDDRNRFVGIEAIKDADVLIVSVRRRTPPVKQLSLIRRYVESGKPVIGIRTANHAFSLRKDSPAEGYADWPSWDADVFGGSYTNHFKNDRLPEIRFVQSFGGADLSDEGFVSKGSLYRVSPVHAEAEIIANGELSAEAGELSDPVEPVAWEFHRSDGGYSFYTSLGHKSDFETSAFVKLLKAAIVQDLALSSP
ncbi:MAG: ThuA domain-containing protein [Planctomycetota bacterium]